MMRPLARFNTVFLLAFFLSAAVRAQESLTTPIDNWVLHQGAMFDVQATGDLRITGLDAVIYYPATTVEIWRSNGPSFVTPFIQSSDWTLLGSRVVNGVGATTLTPLGIPIDIDLAAGESIGLFVMTDNSSLGLTPGANFGGIMSSNTDLQLLEGIGLDGFFSNLSSSLSAGGASRRFNGRIHYSIGNIGEEASLWGPLSGTGNYQQGLVFDVAAKESIVVEGFTGWLHANQPDVEIWTTIDGKSWVGQEAIASRWRLLGTVYSILHPNAGSPFVRIPLDFEIPINGGERRGFLIQGAVGGFSAVIQGISASMPGEVLAIDEAAALEAGLVMTGGFYPTTFAEGLCGAVHYRRTMANPSPPNTVSSLSAGGGFAPSQGVFFDVQAHDFVQIRTMTGQLSSGTYPLELWAVTDGTSHVGKTTNTSLWTRVATATVTGGGTSIVLFSDLRLQLDPSQLQGFYLTCTSGQTPFLASGSSSGTVINGDLFLAIVSGQGANYPFIANAADRGPWITLQYLHADGLPPSSFHENFSGATGLVAPGSWLTGFRRGNDPTTNGWQFSNPGGRSATLPIDADFAICDSDYFGSNNQLECVLLSPPFNAEDGKSTLTLDHWHRFLLSQIWIDVWDGTTWNTVFTTTQEVPASTRTQVDITAAAGGALVSRVRFRYVGNWDWWWILDNVAVETIGLGQEPRPDIGMLDVNWARERNGVIVSSGLPGPYHSEGSTGNQIHFHFEGPPMQPVILLQGTDNVNGWDFLLPGKLDVGYFVPATGGFTYLEAIADGTMPGFVNALFRTDAVGRLDLAFPLPLFTAGFSYRFQAAILNNYFNVALTNMVVFNVDI